MSMRQIRADLKALQQLQVNEFPAKWRRRHEFTNNIGDEKFKDHYVSEYTFRNNAEIESLKTHYKMQLKGFHQCFFCNRWSKEGKAGIYRPMDKRESGDNDWGDTYSCFKCVPKEYTRL
jgi:hypothetical protein